MAKTIMATIFFFTFSKTNKKNFDKILKKKSTKLGNKHKKIKQ